MKYSGGIKLNRDQKKAVEFREGPLLIVAGAGTGKTRVITERIRYLIRERKAKPKEVLALTFTEKAAEEMLARVDEVMPIGYEEPWICTFHSFADRILRAEALEIGLDPSYEILSYPKQYLLIRKNLFNFKLKYFLPLGNPAKFIGALISFFSRLQDEAVSLEEFETWVNNLPKDREDLERWRELLGAYKYYCDLKVKESALDFGDLISWCLKLFRDRPNVLSKYKKQFRYILIDEFQDTNYAQFELIQLLAPSNENPNLTVVGDDFQSIYKFRGAALSNILGFIDKYPNAKQIYLFKNYRSNQKILDAAYKLIQNNNPDTLEVKLGINKNLISQIKGKGHAPKILVAHSAEEEAEIVAKKIIELLGEVGRYTYKDFAILARANNHLDVFISTLKRYKIPYQVVGNRGLFNQPEVRDLINFLRVCVNTKDTTALYSLLSGEVLNLDPGSLLESLNAAYRKRTSLWEEIRDKNEFSFIVNEIKKAQLSSRKLPVSAVLYSFVVSSGFPQRLLKDESVENNLKMKNLNLFFDYVKSFEASNEDSTIVGFVDFLDLMIEAGENPAQALIEDVDTVNLLTVHSAKGLEFPVVFMVNLVSGRFPTRHRRDQIEIPVELVKETLPSGDYHIQEERRLFYVGMTRAMDRLFLTYAKNYGGVREKRPSGFLEELGIEISDNTTENYQASLFSLPNGEETPKMRKILKNSVIPPFISYSQIDTFKTCPLKYKYKYVLGIPTPPHHALSFGQSIHNTLRDFHRLEMSGREVTLETIIKIYERHFIPLGYESAEHKKARYESGKEMLTAYFEKYKRVFGKPKFIEQKFRLRVSNTPLIGFIDRIDYVNGTYEIIDYKTGSLKDQRSVDKDEQLTIYALAAKECLKIEPTKLSLYFVEEGTRIDTTRTDEHLDKEKESIKGVISEIRSSFFEPKVGPHCKFCDFRKICPAYKNYLGY